MCFIFVRVQHYAMHDNVELMLIDSYYWSQL